MGKESVDTKAEGRNSSHTRDQGKSRRRTSSMRESCYAGQTIAPVGGWAGERTRRGCRAEVTERRRTELKTGSNERRSHSLLNKRGSSAGAKRDGRKHVTFKKKGRRD